MFTVDIVLSDKSSLQASRRTFLEEADTAGLPPLASTVSADPEEPDIQLDYASRTDAYAAAWRFSTSLRPNDRIQVNRRELSHIWRVRIALSDIDPLPSNSPYEEWRAFVRWVASCGSSCNLRPLRADIHHQAIGCLDFRHEYQARRVANAAPHNLPVDRKDVDVVERDASDLNRPDHRI